MHSPPKGVFEHDVGHDHAVRRHDRIQRQAPLHRSRRTWTGLRTTSHEKGAALRVLEAALDGPQYLPRYAQYRHFRQPQRPLERRVDDEAPRDRVEVYARLSRKREAGSLRVEGGAEGRTGGAVNEDGPRCHRQHAVLGKRSLQRNQEVEGRVTGLVYQDGDVVELRERPAGSRLS